MRNVVIVDVVRTASGRGKADGALAGVHPVNLLADTLNALVARTGIDPALVDDVITGCVSQVGDQALNLGRYAVLSAGWPESVPSTTIDRQCGSSQQAVHFAAQAIMAGVQDVVVACGVESMSRVPMFKSNIDGFPMGPRIAERYPDGLVSQGVSAELIAKRHGFTREDLDEFAADSHAKAAKAVANGDFDREIISINACGEAHLRDQTIRETSTGALSQLRPSFATEDARARFPDIEWKITPGNSSPLTDGASAALLVAEDVAERLGLTPRARVTAMGVVADDPLYMLTAPTPATRRVLDRTGLSLDDIDAYEVNEAFASVPLMWLRELDADPAKLNPRGGAIALGHPLGASGTRLLATLVNYLDDTGGRYGLQTMCEGGGMANATIIERI